MSIDPSIPIDRSTLNHLYIEREKFHIGLYGEESCESGVLLSTQLKTGYPLPTIYSGGNCSIPLYIVMLFSRLSLAYLVRSGTLLYNRILVLSSASLSELYLQETQCKETTTYSILHLSLLLHLVSYYILCLYLSQNTISCPVHFLPASSSLLLYLVLHYYSYHYILCRLDLVCMYISIHYILSILRPRPRLLQTAQHSVCPYIRHSAQSPDNAHDKREICVSRSFRYKCTFTQGRSQNTSLAFELYLVDRPSVSTQDLVDLNPI